MIHLSRDENYCALLLEFLNWPLIIKELGQFIDSYEELND